ncbi:regulatory LuxR family protein [Herbihabitans rhizosphaerae]|uniref:Regulatory LuxR family protein n=1 Tax=Herbihabitans rhizosphaerae TaxID=1872711 RepID=A0A4Q7KHA6_9PSEU|nr:LuxR family transcriptional regulator [Herbihabitans rhizosphaerae]RZS34271.1 regulatory LuxR family protein [Herbihabitans rhizosphaerae]
MLDVPRLGSGIPLVARAKEMRGLRAAYDKAAAGSFGVMLLAGDAGVGKTRLVDELSAHAGGQQALVLTGRCVDVGETGLPYLAFAEVFTKVRALGDDVPASLATPALAMLLPGRTLPVVPDQGRLAPGLPTAVGGHRPEQDVGQLQLFDAVHAVLTELSERTPVVLVVEDLHWADESTRRLLSFLIARMRDQRLLLAATYRTDDLHRRHPLRPLLAELVRVPAVERLELSPFRATDARSFVAALAEGRLDDEAVRDIARRSDGNAFFAEELLAAYSDDACGLPTTLVDVLLSRVEQLGDAAQRVVRAAAVAGRTVVHRRLRDAAGLAEQELEEALREAVQHHVLVAGSDTEDVYSFRHALLREAVYGDLLPGERVRLHASYAACLADPECAAVRGTAAALAYHSMESHALPQALDASVRAAEEAKKLGAPAEALRHVELALKLWDAVPESDRPDGVDELHLVRKASWFAGTSGEPERALAFARSAVRLVDEREDPELRADVRRRLVQAQFSVDGNVSEAAEVIDEAWWLLADRAASPVRAWVLGVQARVLRSQDRVEEARHSAELAIADAREVSAGGAEADALSTLALLAETAGRLDESRDLLRASIKRAAEVQALNVEARARFYLGVSLYENGRVGEAVEEIDKGAARTKETGITWSDYGLELRVMRVVLRYVVGEWDGAEAAAEPPARRVSNTVSARLAAVAGHVTVGRGRFAEAERLVTDLREHWHRDLQIALVTCVVGAELACWKGKPERAVEQVGEAMDWVRRGGGQWLLAGLRVAALGIAAHAEVAQRARTRRDDTAVDVARSQSLALIEDARKVAAGVQPRTGTLGPEGRAWLARAEAEWTRLSGDSDPEAWRAAVDGFDYGAVYEQALCRWRLAEALLSHDRRAEAVDELRAVCEVADRLGARPLQDAVRRVARRARISLSDGATRRDTVDLLTPREHSVLKLVATGRTNRQVGEELYISEKTVSVHLSRIMAKLGATRRAEAAAIAADRGLLD